MTKKPSYEELESRIRALKKETAESEKQVDALFKAAADVLFLMDVNGKFLAVNEVLAKNLDRAKEDLVGKHMADVFSAEIVEKRMAMLQKVVESKKPMQEEDDRAGRYFDNSFYPIFDDDGNVKQIAGFARNITERKRAEEALRESESKYSAVVEQARDGIVIVQNGLFKYVNKGWEQICGYSSEELIDTSFLETLLPGSRELVAERAKRRLAGEFATPVYEVQIRTKDGVTKTVEVSGGIIQYGGHPANMALLRDISDRKRADVDKAKLEEQLQQAHKMEAIGTLAGGIAHDFNNTLAAILINTELALLQNKEDDILRSNLEEIITSVNHGKDLVEQIFAFARPATKGRELLDIRFIIAETHKLLRATLSATIEIRQNIQVKAGTILANPTQIQQVILNLCSNAAHAMGERNGLLEISLTKDNLDRNNIADYPELKPGAYLCLTISDTGQGIDQENIDRIFDPFFTTKEPGEGTGMGLSVVHGIVKNHNGAIRVTSKPGQGSTFQILLPKAEEEVAAKAERVQPLSRAAKGTRILFVDDEKAFVAAGEKMLEHLGYKVRAYTSSVEALKAFRKRPEEVDLVISDMAMPHMSGLDFSKELLQIRPNLPIIVCTGFSEHLTPEKAKAIGIRAMLMKPLSTKELMNAIDEVLEGVGKRPPAAVR